MMHSICTTIFISQSEDDMVRLPKDFDGDTGRNY